MIESLGRAAAETISGLKAQPLVLAQVVLNALFIGLVIFLLHQIAAAGQRRDATVRELINQCFAQLRGTP